MHENVPGAFFAWRNNCFMCKKVAVVMGKMEYGGVEAVVMNYYRHIDRNQIQFDFFVDSDSSCPQKQEIEELGGRIFFVPPYQKITVYMKTLIKLFKENHYAIVHAHINTLSVFPLMAAWIAKVPVRIAHSHSTAGKGEFKKNILKYSLRPFSKVFATDYYACSEFAGRWLFGDKAYEQGKVIVWKNAIDVNKYQYNVLVRNKVREKLGIKDKFVIGHVGRFMYQKNHKFLIEIFYEVIKHRKNAVLLLIGEGDLLDEIRNMVSQLKIDDKVLFLGARKDVDKLYQAMDIFVLPSFYEGLPVVGVEAQAADLPCLFSNKMTMETKITSESVFLPLELECWVEAIIKKNIRQSKELEGKNEIKKNGFDIEYEAKKLQELYILKLNNCNVRL